MAVRSGLGVAIVRGNRIQSAMEEGRRGRLGGRAASSETAHALDGSQEVGRAMGDRADVPAPAATTEPSSPRVADRLARFPLRVMVAAFVAAEVADLGTALSVAGELNPIAAGLLASPIAAAAAKVALILFVVGVVAVTRRVRPLLTRFVLLTGIVAGLFGAITNTHLTPFVLS